MRGECAGIIAVAALSLSPATAGAATARVDRDEDPETGDVEVTASVEDTHREANDLLIRYRDTGREMVVTVRERGRRPLMAGKGCTGRSTFEVRCRGLDGVFVDAGGGTDRVECVGDYVLIHGGRGDDRLTSKGCGADLVGGRGEDVLLGDRYGQWLVGGPGRDVLHGRGGDDMLKGDGRRRGFAPDVIHGGPGRDLASSDERTRPVRVDLGRGTGPEGDRLRGIEDVAGSRGNDTLIGDGGSNRLQGGWGDDRLVGRAGEDVLDGGQGTPEYSDTSDGFADHFDCGPGRDVVRFPELGLLPANCELMADPEDLDFHLVATFPRAFGGRRILVPAVCTFDIEKCRRRAIVTTAGRKLGRSRSVETSRGLVWLTVKLKRRLPRRARVVIEISGQDYDSFNSGGWYRVVPFEWRIACRGSPDCR
jgi:hypothetical protein